MGFRVCSVGLNSGRLMSAIRIGIIFLRVNVWICCSSLFGDYRVPIRSEMLNERKSKRDFCRCLRNDSSEREFDLDKKLFLSFDLKLLLKI